MASLEETLQKFFAEADKNARDRFERLENQLDSIKMTLDQHSKDLDSQRKITTSLQTRMKRVEEATTEHNDTMEKLQQKHASMEDRSRRNNLRIINLKEGVEEDQALAYLVRTLFKWFPELDSSPPELTRAHRVGPLRKAPAPPRTMILNCLLFTDRDRILGFARKSPVTVDGQAIHFTADYSDATARRRRPCFHIMNRACTLGFQAFLLYPATIKLTRGFDQNLYTEPSEVSKFIDSFDSLNSEDETSLLP